MAKTVFENVEITPRVKQLQRKLGPYTTGDTDAIQDVDIQLSKYINDGWKLSFVVHIGSEPSGSTILYILTKD
jgi:hypothetical protein